MTGARLRRCRVMEDSMAVTEDAALGNDTHFLAVQAAAEGYCRALHAQDTDALARIFHGDAHLYAPGADGLVNWPLAVFLERVASRAPAGGEPDFTIHSVDLAGPDMACVKLSVAVPPRRYTDYLNFLKLDGEWRVIAKVFRVAEGPPL